MFEKDVVLVVDPSKQIVSIVCRMLKEQLKFGNVISCTDSKEALDIIREEHLDWVISDWEMPNISGLDLLEEVRKRKENSEVPFILMSARADKESLVEAVSAGISDYIAKPFSPAKLLEKLKRFTNLKQLNRSVRISPSDEYIVEIEATDGKKYNTTIVNVSLSGCLLRSPLLKGGLYLYDEIPLNMKLSENNIRLSGSVIRLDTDKSNAKDSQDFMTVALNFVEVDEQARMCLNEFINKNKLV
ncbi:MAG: response regulator [Gammaproteobacteria bacterium]|nr:response regulator [Gammaproteobacteria bacterium]